MTIAGTRLAIVASHPIQHFVPLYRALAAVVGIDLCVFYASRMGLQPYFDAEMNTTLSWKMDLLSGYPHLFLCDMATDATAGGEPAAAAALSASLAAFAPDAVILYGYNTSLSRRAARLADKAGARLMMISDSELRAPRSWSKRVLKALVLPRLYRQFDAFLTVGDENEAYYRNYGVPSRKLFRSPFPIDELAFGAARARRAEHRANIRSRLGVPADAFLALFVGKLSPRKRAADLLTATALARAAGHEVTAVLVGDGVLRSELEEQAASMGNAAHIVGFINVDELPFFYAGSDVLVHPSESDPHPLICSEAACVGLPMILSDRVGAEGPTDIAQMGANAIVYPVGDQHALASALGRLASDEALTAEMSAHSMRIFASLDLGCSVQGIRNALAAVGLARGEDGSLPPANVAS